MYIYIQCISISATLIPIKKVMHRLTGKSYKNHSTLQQGELKPTQSSSSRVHMLSLFKYMYTILYDIISNTTNMAVNAVQPAQRQPEKVEDTRVQCEIRDTHRNIHVQQNTKHE